MVGPGKRYVQDLPSVASTYTLQSILVPHWDGYWVSTTRHLNSSDRPLINLMQCCISLPVWNQGQVARSSSRRARVLLHQHRPLSPQLAHALDPTLSLPSTIPEAHQGPRQGPLRPPHRSQLRYNLNRHYKLRSVPQTTRNCPLPADDETAVEDGFVHPSFIYVLFWVYLSVSLLICIPMLMVWFNKPHDLTTFTPAWAFLIFPMMLVGVVAFNVLKVVPVEEPRAVGVLLVGYAFQGLGFFMTFFYICIYIIR